MAILHAVTPALDLIALRDGSHAWRCPVCRTHGDGTHVPDSEVCLMLVAERATKCRD